MLKLKKNNSIQNLKNLKFLARVFANTFSSRKYHFGCFFTLFAIFL